MATTPIPDSFGDGSLAGFWSVFVPSSRTGNTHSYEETGGYLKLAIGNDAQWDGGSQSTGSYRVRQNCTNTENLDLRVWITSPYPTTGYQEQGFLFENAAKTDWIRLEYNSAPGGTQGIFGAWRGGNNDALTSILYKPIFTQDYFLRVTRDVGTNTWHFYYSTYATDWETRTAVDPDGYYWLGWAEVNTGFTASFSVATVALVCGNFPGPSLPTNEVHYAGFANPNYQGAVTKPHTADAILVKRSSKTHTANALLRKTYSITTNADALLVKRLPKTHTADALVVKTGIQKTHTADALLVKRPSKTHTADALLWKTYPITTDADALLALRLPKTHTADAYVLKTAETTTHVADAAISETSDVSHDTDAILEGYPENQRAHLSDAGLLGVLTVSTDSTAGVQDTFTITTQGDAQLANAYVIDHDSDAVVGPLSETSWDAPPIEYPNPALLVPGGIGESAPTGVIPSQTAPSGTVANVLSFPFRVETFKMSTIPQGSDQQKGQELVTFWNVQKGERPIFQDYGIDDPAFNVFDESRFSADFGSLYDQWITLRRITIQQDKKAITGISIEFE